MSWPQNHVDITEIKYDLIQKDCVELMHIQFTKSVVQKDLDKNVHILLFIFYIVTHTGLYYLSFM